MLSTERTQSLTDFRQKATETLDRINKTGEAEIITVNGQARGVLVSPAVYDQMTKEALLARDVAAIQRSIQQLDAGHGREANVFFDDVRAKLLAMKAEQQKDASR